MKIVRYTIAGSDNEPIQIKIILPDQLLHRHPIVISHGFKGFMDWGHFPIVAEMMANEGFAVVMFNYSHNGTSQESPSDFVRLDLFAKNTYSRELYDLGKVLDEVNESSILKENKVDGSQIYLVGHSRGGGMCIIKTAEDDRIKKLVTWAAIGSVGSFFGRNELLIQEWKLKGVITSYNARTGQEMPLNYTLFEDTLVYADRLDIFKKAAEIDVPWLIIHGELDPTVPYSVAFELNSQNSGSEIFIMKNAHHNFGGKHPLDDSVDMDQIQLLAEKTICFFSKD